MFIYIVKASTRTGTRNNQNNIVSFQLTCPLALTRSAISCSPSGDPQGVMFQKYCGISNYKIAYTKVSKYGSK